jgi:acyl dehydratase
MTTTVSSIEELTKLSGEHLGFSDWHLVDQARVDLFADATDDHQWIHVDPERAKAGPFGGTIAHGYLTLSLLPVIIGQLARVDGVRMALNYGCNKVRFPAPLPVGSKVRGHVEVAEVTDVPGNGVQVVMRVSVEREGGEKPVCVAESVSRLYA